MVERIGNLGSVTVGPTPRRTRRRAGFDPWLDPVAGAAPAPETAPASPAALPALATGGETEDAERHGEAVLDGLQSLQTVLLSGAAPAPCLARLAELADRGMAAGSPGLESVLQEIRVRAAVELAKRAGGGQGSAPDPLGP